MVGGRGRARPPCGRPDGQADGRGDGRTGGGTDGRAGWLIDGRPGKRMGGQDGLQPRRTDGRTDGQSRTAGQADAKELKGGQLTHKFGEWTAFECVDPPVNTWC